MPTTFAAVVAATALAVTACSPPVAAPPALSATSPTPRPLAPTPAPTPAPTTDTVADHTDSPDATATGSTLAAIATLWSTGRRPGDIADMISTAVLDLTAWLPRDAAIVVEGIDQPARGASVVTLLTRQPGQSVQRWAVGITVGTDGARPSGDRWTLPVVAEQAAPLALEPVADAATVDLARGALATLGWHPDVFTLAVAVDAWPWVATFIVDGETKTVWLRRHLAEFVVAGTTASTTASTTATTQGVSP